MNIRRAILLILPVTILTAISNAQLPLAATTTQPAARPIPITLARSGRQTEILLLPIRGWRLIEKEVVLTAFGRVWSAPADVRQSSAATRTTMTVPNVRVPTVFSIVDRRKRTIGELVAYPDRNVKWNKKIILYSAGTPKWFNQWTEATGLTVKKVKIADFKTVNRRKANDKKHLLILGRKTAGKDFWSTLAIAKKHKINVFVLDAIWFGGKSGKVTVQPKHMAGGLAEFRKQKWSKPPAFGSHRKPWPGIANRWAWISDKEGLPLVEEIGAPTTSNRRIVLSYTPWQEQLGRCDVADLTLLNVLSATAKKIRKPHWRMPDVLYPTPKVLEETEKQRPILAAASKAWIAVLISDIPPRTYVIDLRGKESPPAEFRKTLKWLENRNVSEAPLLILGGDPLLDDWKWAGINRKKKKFKRGGITWLPDDTLPPSAADQIRLMLKLTEFGIPLKHPNPLKQEKKDEKPNK